MCTSIINELNDCLIKAGINKRFILGQNIVITSKSIIVTSTSDMHDDLENHIYPKIPSLVVYHYTSKKSALNIKESNIFRFYCIQKRYGEGELISFLSKFGFSDAFDNNGGLKYFKDYENIFYASFIKYSDKDTPEMQHLSELCEVRLKFRIEDNKGFFRKINYEDDLKFEILTKFHNIAKKYNHAFIIEGMSGRFASYCIDQNYKIENEYRAYWRHWNPMDGFTIKEDECKDKYIEIKLNEENFSGIKITLLDE